MLPVVTTLGMVFSFLLGANVLVEKVFAWPGIGSYAVEALIASDFAPVQGFVLTMAILYVVLNLVDRPALRRDRSAREARGMSDAADAAVRQPAPTPAAMRCPSRPLRHRRQSGHRLRLRAVRADRCCRALLGPCDRAARSAGERHRRRAASRRRCAHWFGTDQLGRDIFSRVVVATRLDFVIAVAVGRAGVRAWAGSPASPPASSAAGPTASSAASPTPSWRFRCSCWRWASSPRSATP